MGFRAKSADEVYRYALRLDDVSRSLTDRFCLSLILVNDHSPVCQEFLADHFVDLCHRTADRIRFVFFAEVDVREQDALARQTQENLFRADWDHRRTRGGFLGSILDLVSGRRRVRPFREQGKPDDWRTFNPAPFFGVDSPENTLARLGHEKDATSAIIRPGEAMRFAQRLGIGKHVPCIVVVTDVGALEVEVFPFEHRSPREAYTHVRHWVDEFYERNRQLFDHWGEVETAVTDLRRQADLTLSEVREWEKKARVPARGATQVNHLIDRLHALAQGDTAGVRAVVASAPDCVRHVCIPAEARLAELVSRQAAWHTRAALREQLPATGGEPAAVRMALQAAADAPALPDPLVKAIRGILTDLQKQLTDVQAGPEVELASWWCDRVCRARPTETGYKKARRKWSVVSAVGAADFGREHSALLAAIAHVPLFGDPDSAARQVLDDLAGTLAVDPTTADWLAQTQTLRNTLRDYFSVCRQTAPLWVRERRNLITFGNLYPSTPVPLMVEAVAAELKARSLPDDHPISRLLASDDAWGQHCESRERSVREVGVTAVRATEAVLARFPDQPPTAVEHEAVYAVVLAGLHAARGEFECEVTRAEREVRGGSVNRKTIAPHLLNRLRATLDEYDEVVNRINYPHRDDPAVLRVRIRMSLPEAAMVNRDRPSHTQRTLGTPKDGLVSQLEESRRLEVEAGRLVAEYAARPPRWTPAARLAEAVLTILPPERVEEVLPAGFRGELAHRLREALAEHRVRDTLARLTDAELSGVLSIASTTAGQGNEFIPPTRLQRVELLLSRVGADVRPPLLGEGRLLQRLDDLDARLDHLSDDEVTFEGTELRRVVEQYLKQFLVMYGPAGLTADERQTVPDMTLGPLTALGVRVLSHDATGEVADRLRRARGVAGWLAGVTRALPRVAQLSNAFPHHIVRDGVHLPPAERRARLAEFGQTTRQVVTAFRAADLYPVCLRFTGTRPDGMYICRFEFECDPPVGGHELVAFSRFPPTLQGITSDTPAALYRQTLLMLPVGNPDRLDPLLVPVWG